MSESKDPKNERGFVVVDRRHGAEGESAEASGAAGAAKAELPRIDFPTFAISLATSALYHLGFAELPDGTRGEKNLPLARQTIDTLEMLQEKTRGNLDSEEAKLIESLLYELHLRFVEAGR
jgi:hypothetical protein